MENEYQIKFGKEVQKLRDSWDWKRTYLATKLDVSLSYISQIESGQKLPTEKRLEELIKILLQNPENKPNLADHLRALWFKAKTYDEEQHLKKHVQSQATINKVVSNIISHNRNIDRGINETLLKEGIKKIPLISWVTAGQLSPVIDEYPAGWAEDWVYTTRKGERMFALKVNGDSMEPVFKDGDVIIVDPDAESYHNDFVIAKDILENEATFKQLRRLGDQYMLHPLNPAYVDIVMDGSKRWVIAGKVVQRIENL